jgi:hypothetical protein
MLPRKGLLQCGLFGEAIAAIRYLTSKSPAIRARTRLGPLLRHTIATAMSVD